MRSYDDCPEDAATFLRWDRLGTVCCRVCMEPLHETADGECIACLGNAASVAAHDEDLDRGDWDYERRFDGED